MSDHRHHIIPKHEWKKRFGTTQGVNSSDNIVYLTAEQHSQAHLYLWELNHNPYDLISHKALSNQIGKEDITSEVSRATHLGKKKAYSVWNKGKSGVQLPLSDEKVQYLREINTKENHPQYGTTHSQETRKKISLSNSKPYSPERRMKKLALVQSPEHKEKMRQARLKYLESRKVQI